VDFLWTPALLLPAALALAGLGVVAGRWLPRVLRETTAGLRQVALMGSVALLGAGLVIGTVRLGTGPYEGLSRHHALLPAFITADEPLVGPYRILLVDQAEDGAVTFEATSASGVSMAQSGTVPSQSVVDSLTTTLETMVGNTDPSAATGLGVLGVRYVVLGPDVGDELVASLDRQRGLSPIPTGDGRAYRVTTWLPRASVLPSATGEQLLVTGGTGEVANAEQLGLQRLSQDRYRGAVPQPEGGMLVLGEAPSSRWSATGDGRELERVAPPEGSPGADLPVNAFLVPPGVQEVEVAATSTGHSLEILAQAFTLLAVASIALRPPGGGGRLPRGQRPRGRGGVAAVRLPAHFDSTGELVSAPLMPIRERSR
jgi:hypothetical protein